MAIARALAETLLAQIREKRLESDGEPTFLMATPEALARLVWRQMGRRIYRVRNLDETRS
jgi:hypothetical protein